MKKTTAQLELQELYEQLELLQRENTQIRKAYESQSIQLNEYFKIVEKIKQWKDSLEDDNPYSSTWSEVHISEKIDEILATPPVECK